jgi:hypothetical protein
VQNNKLFKIVIKLILGFIAVCLLLEGTFRFFIPETIIPAHTVSAFGNPNAWKNEIVFNSKNPFDTSYQATINKNHFRSLKDFPYDKPEKTIRIMGFGNSVMWGTHVNDNETFGYYLEKTLNQRINDFNFEFLNVGKGGWDIINQFIYLKNEGLKYSPDLIIIFRPQIQFHSLNLSRVKISKMRFQRKLNNNIRISLKGIKPQIEENFLIEKIIRQRDKVPFYFEITKVSQFLHHIRKKVSAFWATGALNQENKNNLEKFIKSFGIKDNENVQWALENTPINPIFRKKGLYFSKYINGDKNLGELNLILSQWFLDQILSLATRENIKVLVVETPRDNQILDILHPLINNSYFPPKKGVFIKRLVSDISSFQKQNNTLLLFPDDVHFSPAGNRLAALLIYNFMLESRMFLELESYLKIDLFSDEISRLIQLSNESIQKEIDIRRYSSYLNGWKDIENKQYSNAETNLLHYLEVNKNEYATFLLRKAFLENKKYIKSKNCLYSLSKAFVLTQQKYKYLKEIQLKIPNHELFKVLN